MPRPFQSPRDWTFADINRGIAKIQRRIADLQALLDNNIRHDDQTVKNLELEIRATIEDVFGKESREYDEFSSVRLRSQIISEGFYESANAAEIRKRNEFTRLVHDYVLKLQRLVKRLDEKKDDFRKCPKCSCTYQNLDYCLDDGTCLVALSYDPDSPTLLRPNV